MGVAFRIHSLRGKMFVFVQGLAEQIVRYISKQNTLVSSLIKCLN